MQKMSSPRRQIAAMPPTAAPMMSAVLGDDAEESDPGIPAVVVVGLRELAGDVVVVRDPDIFAVVM